MRILRCDKCGYEVRDTSGITGSEFETHKFVTLSPKYRFGEVVDVCAECFKEVQKVALDVEADRQKAERASFLARMGG